MRSSSSNTVRHVFAKVDRYLDWLKETYDPKLVVLFGSYAKNDWVTDQSDLDLLIVAEGLKDTPYENYLALRREGWVEPLGYSPEAFLKALVDLTSFILLDALEEGRVVYSDKRYEEKVYELFKKLREDLKLVKRKNGWRFKVPREKISYEIERALQTTRSS